MTTPPTSRGQGSSQADKPPREGKAPAEPQNQLGNARLQPSRKPPREREAPAEPQNPSGGRGSSRAETPLGRARLPPNRTFTNRTSRSAQQELRPPKGTQHSKKIGNARPPKPHIHQPDKPVGSAGASPARRKKNLRPETLFSGSFQFSLEHSLTTIAAPLTCADSEKTKKKTREAAFPSLSDFQFETTAHRLSTQDCTIAAGLTSRHKASSINCCSIDCSPDTPGTSVGTCVATGSIGAASGRPRSIAAA